MTKAIMNPKFLLGVCAISLVSLFSISMMNNNIMKKHTQLQQLSSGVGVCFQRVNQTFTALMIKDTASGYLTESFKQTTGECFTELMSSMSTLMAHNTKALNTINNLSSDLHWFNTKINKIIELNEMNELNLSHSNIVKKYEELENLRTGVENEVSREISNFEPMKNLGLAGLLLSQFALLFGLSTLVLRQRMKDSSLEKVESFVGDSSLVIAKEDKVQRIIEGVFSEVNLPKSKSYLTNYFEEMSEESLALHERIIKMNTVGYQHDQAIHTLNIKPSSQSEEEQEGEVTNFTDSLTSVLGRIQEKAFSQGVILDTDLGESFDIYSNSDALDQVLFNTLQYSMESSLASSHSGKVIIRSKPLGGVAYCKIKIQGHAYSDNELNVINGKKVDEKVNVNVNLILLKEMLEDANATVAVKNLNNKEGSQIESELEIIFERAQKKANTTQKVSVLKGTKKELKEYFAQNM